MNNNEVREPKATTTFRVYVRSYDDVEATDAAEAARIVADRLRNDGRTNIMNELKGEDDAMIERVERR